MKKNKFLLAIALIISAAATAQQDGVTSQFIMNKMFINPGYTGYKEQAMLTAVHRSQWLGFKGAPMTQVLSFDTPLKKNELAAGGIVIHDKIGPTSRIGVVGTFAYRTRLTNRATLSWGAQVSADLYQMNLADLNIASKNYDVAIQDDAFLYNTKGLIVPNVGFGAYYHKKDHYLGISCPKMLRPRLDKRSNSTYTLLSGKQEPTIYLMGGKMFKIHRDLFIQSSLLVRGEMNAPMSIGFYGNAIYLKDFNIGMYYHFRENLGAMFQWQIDKQIKVGYSFDIATNTLIKTNYGSHELAVNYALSSKKKRIVYPRYF